MKTLKKERKKERLSRSSTGIKNGRKSRRKKKLGGKKLGGKKLGKKEKTKD